MPNTSPERELVNFADHALALGRGAALFEWWRQLAQVALALAVRTRGWQVNAGGHWVALSPPGSACMRLCTACGLMHAAPTDATALEGLAALASGDAPADPVEEAIRASARAVREMHHLSSDSARRTRR